MKLLFGFYFFHKDNKPINTKLNFNLQFYNGNIKFRPNGLEINDFIEFYKNNYSYLENNHDYIQWLFPLTKQGQNKYSYKLNGFEIFV